MGMRFIPFHPSHAEELGDSRTELFFECLVQKEKFCQKDDEGYFEVSINQIQTALRSKMSRRAQHSCRELLATAGWIDCVQMNGGTYKFRIRRKP